MSKWQDIKTYVDAYNAQLIAVSKNQENDKILQLYMEGQKIFAENRPQELQRKSQEIKEMIDWHLIGHLQSNKVKSVISTTQLIHSVDSLDLIQKINSEAEKINKTQNILLQVKLSQEETKHGFNFDDLVRILHNNDLFQYKNIRICGLMGIGSLTEDPIITRQEFKNLFNYFNQLKSNFNGSRDFKEISMGMSSDYKIALEEGATMVRIGSLLFT